MMKSTKYTNILTFK